MLKKKYTKLSIYLFIIGAVIAGALEVKHQIKKNRHNISGRPDVTIVGPIKMADGIGRQTAELANALMNKYKVQIVANYKEDHDLPSGIKQVLKNKFQEEAKVVIVEESLWGPDEKASRMDRFFPTVTQDNQIRIAYTMLESTRVIREWVHMLNLYFDAVVVPDPFLIDAYRDSGVTIPIFHIPLAVDIKNFLDRPLKVKKEKGPMVFANLSSAIDRKNHVLLIRAFAKAFGNNENAFLLINCRINDVKTRNAIMDELARHNCSNISYTDLSLRNDAYLKLFESVDCYVSLSKAEGFSIQPREAMALGIPVIATDNTGQATICKTGLVRSVKSEILEPVYYYNHRLPTGYQFNCELQDAIAALKDVYLNYDHYLSKGTEARKWAAAYCYSNKQITELYKTLVDPRQVVLGEENKVTKDCIVTDSKELYEKYVKLFSLEKKSQKR